MQEGSKKAIIAAFMANLGISIAKFVGFLITGSAGLLAEAFHSVADTGNQGLLLLGTKRSSRGASREHQFGYGRERYFWAFVVALVLFSLGGLFAIYEGISKFRHPHEAESLAVAIGILLFAVVLETFSLRTAVKEARHVKSPDVSWWRFIRQSKQPELPVVLLEDAGAEIGLLFALVGVWIAHITGDPRWDALGSIAIGLLLVVIAVILAIEMKSLLIGESASEGDEEVLRSAITGHPNVLRVIHLRTEYQGPDQLLVGAKVEFDHSLDMYALADAIDNTELRIRSALGNAKMIFIEPDIFRETHRL